jgi:hypothetical protein
MTGMTYGYMESSGQVPLERQVNPCVEGNTMPSSQYLASIVTGVMG